MNFFTKIRMYFRKDDPDAIENQSEDQNVKSNNRVTGKDKNDTSVGRTGVAAGIVGLLALTSTPAHAGISSILKQLVSLFEDMFRPLIETVMGTFSSILNLFTNQAVGGLTTAMTKGFDFQIQSQKEINNNKVGAATEPPPQMCESDTNAKGIIKAESNAVELAANLSDKSFDIYNSLGQANQGLFEVLGQNLVNKYSDKNEYRKLFNTPLVMGGNISNAEERIRAVDAVDLATYSAVESIRIPHDTSSVSGQKAHIRAMSRINKIETARQILLKRVSSRVVVPGDSESSTSVLAKEVERTYGGDTWRADVSSYADATPLLAEACKNISLSNKLLLKQYESTECLAQIAALQLMEQVGDR